MPAQDRPWRCFVAVPIGPDLREAVAACSTALQARAPAHDWRWTDAAAWHVTLAFMGGTDPAAIPGISGRLARLGEDEAPFTLAAGGLGAFSSRSRARVLWFGIADPDGRLRRLARDVQRAAGMEPESRFRGHLTLARLRNGHETDASDLLGDAPAPTLPFEVDRVVLYRSHLGGGPARYEELAVAPLTGVAA